MRVFVFILRCLGISAILLYCAAAFAQEGDNQNITVNFPDQMNVTGTVSIDPGTFAPVDPDLQDVTHFKDPVSDMGSDTIKVYDGRNEVTAKTYVSTFRTYIRFDNSVWDSGNKMSYPFSYDINIELPKIDYNTLFNDLQYVFFGSDTSTNIFKEFDRLKNGRYNSVNSIGFKVKDFTNTLNWEIDCKTPYAWSSNNPLWTYAGTATSSVPVIIQTLLSGMLWIGVCFSIINTVKNG